MTSPQRTAEDARTRPLLVSARHRLTVVGLWLAALGIFIQAATGATGYPKIPPGIIILAAVGILVYATSRWRWASIIGVLLAGLISIGVFTTPGTEYRLSHPEAIGPFLGTLLQLLGLVVALVAGIHSTVKAYASNKH